MRPGTASRSDRAARSERRPCANPTPIRQQAPEPPSEPRRSRRRRRRVWRPLDRAAAGERRTIRCWRSRAGEEMAQEARARLGLARYWRAGFARGVDAALDDPRLGAVGSRAGDAQAAPIPGFVHWGPSGEGSRARRGGRRRGGARSREQFMDLARLPGRDARRSVRCRPARRRVPFRQALAQSRLSSTRVFVDIPGRSNTGPVARRSPRHWSGA